ncbi:MAG TPA: 1-phosphofructokinase family hexose kinase [Gaiellales bacterium]|jgi:1-phosphofructokinase/tagatose 6-phosphate kinase
MILTVTVNAAVDKTLTVANLQLGRRHRAQQGLVMPGGKGINVARSLRRLSEPVIATGLAGGRAGTQITDGLDAEGIVNDFVRIGAESRTSTAVVDPTSGLQTEINEYGPEVTADEVAALLEKVRYLAGAVSTVVLAGSLPRRVETSFYADLIRELSRRKVRTVIDTEGEPLRLALAAEPSLVFPNQREAEALVGNEFQTDEDFQAGLATIAAMGAGGVLVTLKTGCYALLSEGKGRRQMYRAWIPRVEAVSAVGSGDAFLAGFLAAHQAGHGPEQALRTALACGAANTQAVGAGVFDPRDVPRYAAMVEVQEITGTAARAS